MMSAIVLLAFLIFFLRLTYIEYLSIIDSAIAMPAVFLTMLIRATVYLSDSKKIQKNNCLSLDLPFYVAIFFEIILIIHLYLDRF